MRRLWSWLMGLFKSHQKPTIGKKSNFDKTDL